MNFVFVDETGDPGDESLQGSTAHFGMTAVSIDSSEYKALRLLLSQIHWLRGTATTIELRRTYHKSLDLLRGLKVLADHGVISASGIYIKKGDYGGRYLKWADDEVPRTEWTYYLRNYLLRHSLEHHFSTAASLTNPIDLVLDRVVLTETQRENTYNYLNSKIGKPLREPFLIPPVNYLTIGDSEYIGGLEIAHVLADILREIIKGTITLEVQSVSDFIRISEFIGRSEQ